MHEEGFIQYKGEIAIDREDVMILQYPPREGAQAINFDFDPEIK